MPVVYGEGTRAVGRLLEYVLTGSGDATILAWTGTANDYNSCLPMNLAVALVPPHISHMGTSELDPKVATLYSSLPDPLATTLYDRLYKIPSATMVSRRLRLPGIAFRITNIVQALGPDAKSNFRVYRATSTVFGNIKITTITNLVMDSEHRLVHPWVRRLLNQEHTRGTVGLDKTTRALRLVAQLKQPFGALLFEEVSWVDYWRVAADSLIMVQMRDEVPLTDLMDNIETMFSNLWDIFIVRMHLTFAWRSCHC